MAAGKGLLLHALDGVERAGNKLPDPITRFALPAGIVVIISWRSLHYTAGGN